MRKAFWLALAMALVISALATGPALAAKGGGNHGTSTNGTCEVTPNPLPAGGMYTVNGSGFTAGELLNVYVKDSHGTQAFMLSADAAGTISVSSYASWAGTSTVLVYHNAGRKSTLLTTCSFQVN